jgi:cytosine/adenosine deaminase-related metal-dependent hydrolase
VLGAAETLRAATIHAAHVLRMDGRLGVVAPGATADLLLVDGNPLQDISVLTGQGEHLGPVGFGRQPCKRPLLAQMDQQPPQAGARA